MVLKQDVIPNEDTIHMINDSLLVPTNIDGKLEQLKECRTEPRHPRKFPSFSLLRMCLRLSTLISCHMGLNVTDIQFLVRSLTFTGLKTR